MESLATKLAVALDWYSVPGRVEAYVAKLATLARDIDELPSEGLDAAWADTESNWLVVKLSAPLDEDAWREKLAEAELKFSYIPGPPDFAPAGYWIKVGSSFTSPLRRLGQVVGLVPNGVPGLPNPMVATLAGGALGAGLGYGAGWLGEQVLPADWQRGKLRRTLAIAGGALGAAPGMAYMADNAYQGKSLMDNSLTNTPADTTDNLMKAGEAEEYNTGLFPPPINVAEFNQTIWRDPHVAGPLTPPVQAAVTGLMTGAAQLAGSGWVTPADIARVAAGMGAGYLSGAIVGRTLGALIGLPEPVQQRLKQTGVWAGMIRTLVPIVFSG